MKKAVRLLVCIFLLLGLVTFSIPGIALAQEEEEEPTPVLISAPAEEPEPEEPTIKTVFEVNPTYPKIESIAGGDFEFEVEFVYFGPEAQIFDLRTTAPAGWEVYMTPPYEKEKKISSIRLEPSLSAPERIRMVATAPFWPLPEPGDYPIKLEAVSDKVQATTDLTAVITAKYFMTIVPTNERYNTTATAGKDNYFSLTVQSLSSAPIDNIQFSSTHPDGWTVDFEPDKIDTMDSIGEQTVEVNIKPPAKAIAGDYLISVRGSGKQITADEVSVRVTVETPTVWGWVGVIIILIVVVALAVIFMRFSRR